MSKRLVDIEDTLLEAARAELGTPTIKATVNEALRLAGARRNEEIRYSFEVLASSIVQDRSNAWR